MRRESEPWLVERAVLAACLRDPSGGVRDRVAASLDPIFFQDEENRRTWKVIEGLQTPIDEVSLAQGIGSLTLEHWGGLRGLYELSDTVPHTGLVERHVQLLRKLNHRPAHEESLRLVQLDLDDGHSPEHALARLDALKEEQLNGNTSFKDATSKAVDHFLAIDAGELASLSTPWPQLNTILGGGLMPGLIIIAARPSVGKTALALSLATHYAKSMTVAYLSLEMSAAALAGRVIQATLQLRKPTGRNFYVQDHRLKLKAAPDQLENLHLKIFDSIHQLAPALSQIEAIHPRIAFIDYLQLLESSPSDGENRAAQVSAISRQLKLLSLKLDLPIVALSQLNREAEKTGRAPRLSDLRESGSIEQDADVVIMMNRVDDDVDEAEQEIKIEIAKNRSGATGRLKLTFKRSFQTFHGQESSGEGAPF